MALCGLTDKQQSCMWCCSSSIEQRLTTVKPSKLMVQADYGGKLGRQLCYAGQVLDLEMYHACTTGIPPFIPL